MDIGVSAGQNFGCTIVVSWADLGMEGNFLLQGFAEFYLVEKFSREHAKSGPSV